MALDAGQSSVFLRRLDAEVRQGHNSVERQRRHWFLEACPYPFYFYSAPFRASMHVACQPASKPQG